MYMEEATNDNQFGVGDAVPETGKYICVPCGDKKELAEGDAFPHCLSCFDEEERAEFATGQELWERI
jgi:hypothetical protein